MLDYDEKEDECRESANRAAEMVQKHDIVICLWSYASWRRNQLFSLLGGDSHHFENHYWKFYAQHVKHPTSGIQILLISMPDMYPPSYETKKGLQRLLSQMDKVNAKFSAHIWVHDISQPVFLVQGRPYGWDTLKEIFEGNLQVGMDSLTLLSTDWEKVSLETGQKWEMEIQVALRDDVEQGLLFERLEGQDKSQAWEAIQKVIESSSDEGRALRRENLRVPQLQGELDALYAELDKTEYGREIRTKFKKVADNQTGTMVPLVEKLDNEDLKPKEKEQLEKKINCEYMLVLREFRGYFAEMRAMRIEIGPHLRDFYGLLEPKKKKRLDLF